MRTAVTLGLMGAVVVTAGGPAQANGRFPATVNVKFRPGAPETVLVPSTFGLLISQDGGTTYRWVCESAIGYTGTYDPDYLVSETGDIYATTFEGLRVSRDGGCSFESLGPPVGDGAFISQIDRGPDGRIWAATATGSAVNDVFVSTDGETFSSSGLDSMNWWLSVATTPDDPTRIYVSGYKPDSPIRALLRRRTTPDGPWETLPLDDVVFGEANPFFYLVGVSPTDANVLFGRAVAVNPPIGDALYRSIDGGQNWTKVLDFVQSMTAFTIRADGETVIAGSVVACPDDPVGADKGCVRISHDGGETWELTAAQPLMQCVGERPDGKLFACGANFAPDMFAIGTSDDGESWDPVWRFDAFEDPAQNGPLECPADTIQATECVTTAWPALACGLFMFDLPECARSDAGPMANDGGPGKRDDSWCQVGGASSPGLAVLVGLWLILMWARKRRRP